MAARVSAGEHAVKYTYALAKRVGPPDEGVRRAKFVIASVFGRDVDAGDKITHFEQAATVAYKMLLDMRIEPQHALSILRFFRVQFGTWDGEAPFILSLNDGRYAVVITKPECRRIYDYRADVDRSHPTGAIPLPVPVVQVSVNLSKALELGL